MRCKQGTADRAAGEIEIYPAGFGFVIEEAVVNLSRASILMELIRSIHVGRSFYLRTSFEVAKRDAEAISKCTIHKRSLFQ
jgi:hypothetical protein